MQELPLALLRFGVLALLWLFVLAAIRVIRSDLSDRPSSDRPSPNPLRPGPSRQPAPGGRAARRSAIRSLVVTSGPLAGAAIRLENAPVTFGRSDACTLVIRDDYVSNQHAQLTPAGDRWLLEDLGSTNGTYLDGHKVVHPTPVEVGAPIRFGQTVVELR